MSHENKITKEANELCTNIIKFIITQTSNEEVIFAAVTALYCGVLARTESLNDEFLNGTFKTVKKFAKKMRKEMGLT